MTNTLKPIEELNEGHWHEACDRTHCVIEIIDNMLVNHPAIAQDPVLLQQVQYAQEILGTVYQAAGEKF